MQIHKDKHSAQNFSENFQWNFSGMIGILSLFIHLRQYSASQEEKYLLLQPVICTSTSVYAMLWFNNSDYRGNEHAVMKDLSNSEYKDVNASNNMQTVYIKGKLF